MIKIKLDDGKTLSASSAKSMVYKLMRTDFIAESKTNYIKEVQKRLSIVFDIDIKAEVGKWMEFLDELDRTNFITILKRR